MFTGSRDCFTASYILDPIDILHRNAEKTEDKSRRLCENNNFLYSFNSFLDTVSECMDNPAADNSSGFRNGGVIKSRGKGKMKRAYIVAQDTQRLFMLKNRN